jgi:hypothetical protein
MTGSPGYIGSPAGYFFNNSTKLFESCGIGKHKESIAIINSASDTCTLCEAGTYNNDIGATSCNACESDETPLFSDLLGATSKEQLVCSACSCSIGTRCPKTKGDPCVPCGNGTINTLLGQKECKPCTGNTFAFEKR